MDINPAWMKFDYYQAKGQPGRPHPGAAAADAAAEPLLLLHPVDPRLHRGLRAVTINKTAAPGEDTGPQAAVPASVAVARLARALAARRHHDDAAPAVAEEPAGVRGAARRGLARPQRRPRLRAARHVRLRLRVGRGLLRQRRRRRRAGPAAPGEAEPADRLGRAARAARDRARRARGAVRGRRGRGDPRAAARRHGVGVPVLVVPLLVQAQARAVRRDADRGVRVRAAGARRRGGDAREAVGLVPAGVQPRRARRDGGQAVHRADQPGRGRGQAPPGDALVPAGACCASRR